MKTTSYKPWKMLQQMLPGDINVQAHHMTRQAHPASFGGCCDWEPGLALNSSLVIPMRYVVEAVTGMQRVCNWKWLTVSMFQVCMEGLEGQVLKIRSLEVVRILPLRHTSASWPEVERNYLKVPVDFWLWFALFGNFAAQVNEVFNNFNLFSVQCWHSAQSRQKVGQTLNFSLCPADGEA